jgi:GT2 family glycosyltransferase
LVNEQAHATSWAAVIVNYNSAAYLDGCLRALTNIGTPPDEIIVVDNASSDDSLADLAIWPRVVVDASPRNLGFAGGANRGIARSEAPIVVLLNPDVELDPGYGAALLRLFADNPALGAAGAKLRYPDSNLLQHAGADLDRVTLTSRHRGHREEDHGQWDEPTDADYVIGAALALRRTAFDQIGGFDERFWPAYYEDVDLCWRLRAAGWKVRYQPELSGVHVESVTLGFSATAYRHVFRSRLRFALKHLTAEAWWGSFIPAEMTRLRGAISAIDRADWPVTTGASALEELARFSRIPHESDAVLLDGEPLLAMIQALAEVRERRVVVPDESTPVNGVGRISEGILRRFLGRQQVFNDAVTRALEAQDRVNRELSAQILLTFLDLGWRNAILE